MSYFSIITTKDILTVNAEDDGETLLEQEIALNMEYRYYSDKHCIVWHYLEPLSIWCIVFDNRKEEENFTKTMTSCLYESSFHEDFANLKLEDQNVLVASMTQILEPNGEEQPFDSDYYDFDRDDEESEDEESEEEESEEEDEKRGKTISSPKVLKSGVDINKFKNSEVADSYSHHRSFVIRGPNIGVFKHDDDDEPIYDNIIADIKTKSGNRLIPSNIMLHERESGMLCLHHDPNERNQGKIFKMDLTRGEIVEEWQAYESDTAVLQLTPLDKFAPQTPEQTFGALNKNTIFGIDPRLPTKNKAVNITKLAYASNPRFSCLATSKEGELVVGSDSGEIRFYSGIPGMPNVRKSGEYPKTAKVLLPGIGYPVKGVDVSADGKWVIATCESYLLLIKAEVSEGKNAFRNRISANEKPAPKVLRLREEDEQMIGKVKFTTARFNTGESEVWIVASTGPYVITWNFNRVKNGQLQAYTMKKERDDVIVENRFASLPKNQPGINAPILVVTPDNFLLEHLEKKKDNMFPKRKVIFKEK
jgi:hypothetical protein